MLSGLNFPGSHSKLSASPWSPASTRPAPSAAQTEKLQQDEASEIQIIEEDEEEVLVDAFDGQCCRTYPYNHSKIQRWRDGKYVKDKEKQKLKEADEKKVHDRREIPKHLTNVQNLKIPTSSCEKSVNSTKQNDTITTSAGIV